MKNLTGKIMLAIPLTLGVCSIPATYADSNVAKVQQNVSDTAITTQVKAKIAADKILNPLDVSVATHNGNVALKGTVNSDTEYEQAVSLAQSVDGVKDVDVDDLKVKDSESPLTDLAITAKVNGKLIQDNLFSSKELAYMGFDVETKNQVVYLKGKVKSEAIKNNIEQIAKSISGVKSVDSALNVSQ